MRFDIQPYGGALPVFFGMTRPVVRSILGPPNSTTTIWDRSGFAEHYLDGGYNVGYDNDWIVNHLGFGPCAIELSIQGKLIWTESERPDPNPILLSIDPEPIEFVGFWNFLRIGVTTTGFHDDDPSQYAITVFKRGSKSNLLAEAKPADTSKYLKNK